MEDIKAAEREVDECVGEVIKKYGLSSGVIAWILLCLGTNYYLKDIAQRYVEGKEL